MKKFLLAFLSFLPGLAFAQTDIGSLIFRDILKMSSYPGSPFSGNIINDLVMFLFIPTVFIIVIIYTLAGRLTDNTKIDLLLSVAFYLFIVFGGYYSIFALLAGPYFLFMLIIMGLFMFFLGHFGLRRGGLLQPIQTRFGALIRLPVPSRTDIQARQPSLAAGPGINADFRGRSLHSSC